MIPKECKRLAEVDFPIAVVGSHSAREKPIVRRHPQALHQWWARRPLAACRAILLGLLLPDPCDDHCPQDFKKIARELLPKVQGEVGPKDEGLRKSLLKFIGDFASWDLSGDRTYLEISRSLVKAAHPEEAPLVVDPFAGGGAIPLEALRLGCETFGSDLNPVACLILKVLLEDIPRNGPKLSNELRRVGKEIIEAAEKELAVFYPPDPDGSKPIAYLWARTVRCEQPNCGAEIPLARSFWLCKKSNRMKALRYEVNRPKGKQPYVKFEIFEPDNERAVPAGTVSRAKAVCSSCNVVLSPDRVRAQLTTQRGGADVFFDAEGNRTHGARLLAVVTLTPGEQGRKYRLATEKDLETVLNAMSQLKNVASRKLSSGLSTVPDESTPAGGGSGAGRAFSVQKYGMMTFGDLFTARQKLNLCTLVQITAARSDISESVKRLLAFVVSRAADRHATLVGWDTNGEKVDHVFKRQALPMTWDFAEGVPLADASGGLEGIFEQILGTVEDWAAINRSVGQATLADAASGPLLPDSARIWFTDPPYYDAVPYADLSDFFFVWLKRCLPDHPLLRDPFDSDNPLTPKSLETVQDETKNLDGHPKNRHFFEDAMGRAFSKGADVLTDDGIGCVVFAHKTTEGWEALLAGMIRGGLVITASWPISTERPNRLRARDSGALATSVHLVCRPRTNQQIGDWGEVLRELPRRVGDWMERLQSEHIRGADLVFACIGPALEIYSRYSKVVDAEDREIPLGGDPEASEPHKRGYLAYVWEAVGRAALEQVLGTAEAGARNGAAGALEEDARLTALFLWTLQSTNGEQAESGKQEDDSHEQTDDEEEDLPKKKKKGLSLVFDVVRRFAQPLGIHLDIWEDRIIETDKGIVRLLPVAERGEQLFGQDGADLVAERLERESASTFQLTLFPEKTDAAPRIKGKKGRGKKGQSENELRTRQEATTLDRVHAAMLLQASGRTNALRALLQAEQDRGPDFLRLANALSALYPKQSEEKRLLDAMLLTVPK
jgi:putative DNA methylase